VVYDHSFMHHDFQPYFAPDGSETWVETDHAKAAEAWMSPMTRIRASGVVEIPANWHLDDWPPLQPIPGKHTDECDPWKMFETFANVTTHCFAGRPGAQGFVDTAVVEKLWLEQFDFAYREYETFIFPMSIHPQVSGKPHVILMHER